MVDLGTLPDLTNPGSFLDYSSAFGINNNGTIIGTADAGMDPNGNLLTGATQLFNGWLPISLLPVQSDGFDVGPNDQVVGSFDVPARGFVFHSTTGLVDLTSFAATAGITITFGTGVNASGQISPLADIGGSSVGVLITP
jgi:hypothetical protein